MKDKVSGVTGSLRCMSVGIALTLLLSGCGHFGGTVPAPQPQESADAQPLSAAEVTKAQRMLNSLGYDAGIADGVLGPRSISAIRSFQKDQHIAEDGKLTAALTARLTAAQDKLPKDTLPRYEIGEIVIYSDGSSERIRDVADDIRIEVDGLERREKPENFLIFAEAGEHTDAPADFLQPLRPGATGQYKIYRPAAAGRNETVSTVSCTVKHARQRNVPAGKFKTVEAVCSETSDAGLEMEREWAYAPALHQVVREVVRVEGRIPVIRELVAIRPGTETWPVAASTGLDWAIVNALESDAHSSPVAWSSTGVGERFSIRVDRTSMRPPRSSPAGVTIKRCLRYKLVRTDSEGGGRIYPGLACQSGDGEWLIPARQRYVFASPPKGL